MATVKDSGFEALEKLKATEPPVFLAPSSISEVARAASQYLFEKLKPYNPKSPFDQLLVDGFDAEQIWQQIDMQSQPLLSSLRQEVKRFSKNPEEIRKLGNLALKVSHEDDVDEMDMDAFDSDDDNDDDELEANESEGEEEDEDEEEDGEEEEEEKDGDNEGIEDKFFKIKELEEFLEEGEAEEYGTDYKNKKGVAKRKKHNLSDDDEDEEDDEEDEDEEEDDEVSTYLSVQEYKVE